MPEFPTQPHHSQIAAIVPCYNEAESIQKVLEVLSQVPEVDEILIVDDGSIDGSAEIVSKWLPMDKRVRLIRHPMNRGKGNSMFTGWASTNAQYLLFLDADLHNLKPDQVRDLMKPVLAHQAEMTLGVFRGGHIHTDFAHWVTPWLTGQRCLRADLMKYLSKEAAAGYGFEVALTIAAKQRNYRTRLVPLRGVYHPPSEFHRGFLTGIRWRAKMYGQIIKAFLVSTQKRRAYWKSYFISFPKS